ncbi:MAG: single-stranded DNA-binding protein [Clostridioides difficile]|nr:single-stranded DNA-binding protein [Clostridioides difficile]
MNSLLKEAIDELKNIHCGEVFLLKELFKGYEWNRLEMNIRLKLGKLFLYEVVTNPNLNVEVINKNSAYQQMYKNQKLKLLIQNNHSILTFINMSKFI